MLFKNCCFVLVGLCLIGCDKDDKEKVVNIVENDTDLVGSWEGDCAAFDKLGLTAVRSNYGFHANGKFEKSEQYFSSADCSKESIEFRMVGTYETANRDDSEDKITYSVEESYVNLQSEGVVTLANALNFCGRNHWEVGEKQEVVGEDCKEILSAKAGDTLHDIYGLTDGNLYFGETLFYALTGDDLGTALNTAIKYAKQ